MGGRWHPYGFGFSCFMALVVVSGMRGRLSLNSEGLALLDFRARIDWDPYGVLANWNPNDTDPCGWSGVHCMDGEVQMLDLSQLSLEGTLAPELGKLSNLRSLILFKNHFSGTIPNEIGELKKLEQLDLRENNLCGVIPAEIGRMVSLKRLLIRDNNFEGSIPLEIRCLNLLSKLEFDDNHSASVDTGIGCMIRKFGHAGQRNSKLINKADSFIIPIKGALGRFIHILCTSRFRFGKDTPNGKGESCCSSLPSSSEPHMVHAAQKFVSFARRRLLEQSTNLAAAPASDGPPSGQIIALPITKSSGALPAVPHEKKKQHSSPAPQSSPADHEQSFQNPSGFVQVPGNQQSSSGGTSGNMWKYFISIAGVAVLLMVAATVFCMLRSQAVATIGPWKTGLSGQLQKAFITGVPKLNRSELETACEDFSNIIDTLDGCTIYKGTLSSGVEIAVASTLFKSSKDWSNRSEMAYRKKIDILSRVNHKNFVNLIGYCEEDEPFARMMVFEYAPNGTLFEHLHVKEIEHLDWSARMRIIMGTAYCLQYMHHDLNPPVAHSNLNSTAIYLTDDYAAKIAEICFLSKAASKLKTISEEEEKEDSKLPPLADPETNICSFGILLLEIISGKLPFSEEQGHLVNWASEYLNDKRRISYMIDPTLKSFKNDELDVICEVIQECIQPDPRQRPTMKCIIAKLREVIAISPDQATPRLSPLWWAELEILSTEAT